MKQILECERVLLVKYGRPLPDKDMAFFDPVTRKYDHEELCSVSIICNIGHYKAGDRIEVEVTNVTPPPDNTMPLRFDSSVEDNQLPNVVDVTIESILKEGFQPRRIMVRTPIDSVTADSESCVINKLGEPKDCD